ncbi:MAG: hypothetical protein Q8P68_05140 [Candidatus Peregrinibacteria bacterium]|nr:hypothetical protein [Candidatus Peregrinibacteria bacterium]MDZ4244463.1 hypothetical protein [Candidatus Gracilibacteria bacterium]
MDAENDRPVDRKRTEDEIEVRVKDGDMHFGGSPYRGKVEQKLRGFELTLSDVEDHLSRIGELAHSERARTVRVRIADVLAGKEQAA